MHTHLRWNIIIKVTRVLWTGKIRSVGRRVSVNIPPIDAFEPRVGLRCVILGQRDLKKRRRKNPALMRCAPSPSADDSCETNPLLRACTTIEFGRDTEEDV